MKRGWINFNVMDDLNGFNRLPCILIITLTIFLILTFLSQFTSAALMFTDSFENGNLSSDQNGYGWGPANNSGSGTEQGTPGPSVSANRAYSGTYGLEMPFGPSQWTSKTFHFGEYLTELWMEYWLYVPLNYVHGDASPSNNKFFLIYRDIYSGGQTMNFEIYNSSGGSYMIGQMSHNGSGSIALIRDGVGGTTGSVIVVDPFIKNSSGMIVPGNWAQIRVHIKSASSANGQDGISQIWINGDIIFNKTDLNYWFAQGYSGPAIPQPEFHNGYILGATNADFVESTIFYLDDMKMYNSDPGWGAVASNVADLNTDDKVDFSDILIIIRRILGLNSNSAADMNNDGAVNIFDLVNASRLFGKQYGTDITAPTITSSRPVNNTNLSAGATSVVLFAETNERATCRYLNTTGGSFATMNNFTRSGRVSHSIILTGLSDGTTYNYYIQCQDETGNLNSTNYHVRFSVANTSQQGIFLEVDWSTATGNSVAAVGDGGKGIMRWCSWDQVLNVTPGAGVGWTNTANALSIRSINNCGHVEFPNLFPLPVDGQEQFWTVRYYVMNGVGQTDTKQHPMCFWPVGNIETVHTQIWHNNGIFTNGDWEHGSGWGDRVSFGLPVGHWRPVTTLSSNAPRQLTAGTWYRYEFIMNWVNSTHFRVYPRLYDMDGTLLNDYTTWEYTDGQGTLASHYALGKYFIRNTASDGVDNIRDLSFGMGQAGSSNQYYYVADAAFALGSNLTDFIGE